MTASFVLEFWKDGEWLVGRLKGVPGVFSQGHTLTELEDNIRDAAPDDDRRRRPGPRRRRNESTGDRRMKRRQFVRELENAGCELLRHGGGHDIYRNPTTGRQAPVPRHTEIADSLCRLIRKQLGLTGG